MKTANLAFILIIACLFATGNAASFFSDRFPLFAVFEHNVRAGSGEVGNTDSWVNLGTPETPISITFIDPVPDNTFHSQKLQLQTSVRNRGDRTCIVRVQINSGEEFTSSEIRFAVGPGKSFTRTTRFDGIKIHECDNEYLPCYNVIVGVWYKFVFDRPQAGDEVIPAVDNGENVITYTLKDSTFGSCDDSVDIGAVVIITQYAEVGGADGDTCQNSGNCYFGTCRWGYCACWSGAYGVECVMNEDNVDPEPQEEYWYNDEVDNSIWDKSNTDIYPTVNNYFDETDMNEARYPGLDDNIVKSFKALFGNHPTCSGEGENGGFPGITENLATGTPPSLLSVAFIDGLFRAKIGLTMTDKRGDFTLYINNRTIDNVDCVYPISPFIFKDIEECTDVLDVVGPWSAMQRCHWDTYENEGYLVWKGQFIVNFQEWIVDITEWRYIQAVLRMKLRFQLFASVTTEIVAFEVPELRAAITQQIVAVDINDPAIIEIVTLSNYPYYLKDPELSVIPSITVPSANDPDVDVEQSIIADYDITLKDCTIEDGQACKQRWYQIWTLVEDVCELDGAYALNLTRTCGEGLEEDCPLDDERFAIDFTLDSEDFCAEIQLEIALTGTLASFKDTDFEEEHSSFIEGDLVRFLVEVESSLNTEEETAVEFSGVTLVEVYITPLDGEPESDLEVPYAVYDDEEVTALALEHEAEFQVIPGLPDTTNTVGFEFTITGAMAAYLERNSFKTFSVSAVVRVDYADGGDIAKRTTLGLFAEASTDNGYATEIEFEVTATVESDITAESEDTADSSFALLASFLAIFVAMF
eukprot:TRINITY_DN9676_c0_g1_i1.p1 TRINITY_DN9676_c0_g1~~TRINITY_DN9676_c0_g1_i1.p1  ORF type:complete len:811 (+),score=252.08 TRINITY_DN9676_c0_g1_i1:56-2488(+)